MAAGFKQYIGQAAAGTVATPLANAVAPQNPQRIALHIQNTGANPLLVQFSNKVRGDGSDLALAAGALVSWNIPQTCPKEAINIGSVAGTTCMILEGNSQ